MKEENINKELKQKEKKKKKLAIFSSIALLLTGCSTGVSKNKEDKYSNDFDNKLAQAIQNGDPITTTATTTPATKPVDKNNTKPVIDASNLLNSKLVLNEESYKTINKYNSELKNEYPYTDITKVEYVFDNYYSKIGESMDFKPGAYPFYKDGKIDSAELFNVVKTNNNAYKKTNKYTAYAEFDDLYIKEVCKLVAKSINESMGELINDSNIDDLLENLNDLKIFDSINLSNGTVTDDNCLTLSPVGIKNMARITGYDNAFDIIISHEANHLVQKLSTKTREKENISRGYGFNVAFENIKVNSMYYNWLIEAAAENLALKEYNKVEPMTYKTKVGYLNTLTLTQLLNPNYKLYDIERLCQQQSIDEVFKSFGCETHEEKIELLNMLEAINIIQDDDEEFLEMYTKDVLKKDSISDNELVSMKINLKNSACTTMSKYFYTNLAKYIETSDASLKNVYDLIMTYEIDMSYHISYDTYVQRKNFVENYVNIQSEFFKELSNCNDIEVDTLYSEYEKYYDTISVQKKTLLTTPEYDWLSFEGLSKDKEDFVNRIYVKNIEMKTDTINETSTKHK